MAELNRHGVPMPALLASMLGIVLAIVVQLSAPKSAYLYMINTALVGGMIAWLVSLLAHVRFRRTISSQELAQLGLRSPLGGFGSMLGFAAVLAAIAGTWWVSQSSVAAKSAVFYLLVLTVAYWALRRKGRALTTGRTKGHAADH